MYYILFQQTYIYLLIRTKTSCHTLDCMFCDIEVAYNQQLAEKLKDVCQLISTVNTGMKIENDHVTDHHHINL